MEEYLKFLITPLLSTPDSLNIQIAPSNITIAVATADMGRVIGKGGAVISAIRNLVRAYCIGHNLPFTAVTLAEPQSAA